VIGSGERHRECEVAHFLVRHRRVAKIRLTVHTVVRDEMTKEEG
jgi:hypothetical protein